MQPSVHRPAVSRLDRRRLLGLLGAGAFASATAGHLARAAGTATNRRLVFDDSPPGAGDLFEHVVESERLFEHSPLGLPSRDEAAVPKLRVHSGDDASGHFRDFGGGVLDFTPDDLTRWSEDVGTHVLDCVRNGPDVGFSRLGAAAFGGVRLEVLFARALGNTWGSTRVLVEARGAAWWFTVAQLRRHGAFLATSMNGRPLGEGHGAPLRLVVPGAFACAALKDVGEIRVIEQGAAWTPAMLEMQGDLAARGAVRDGEAPGPAIGIPFSTLPARAEVDERRLNLLGISWGDGSAVVGLEMRLVSGDRTTPWQRIREFESPATRPAGSGFATWRHDLSTPGPGVWSLELRSLSALSARPGDATAIGVVRSLRIG